jgi:predicted nucleotidyltransferase
MQTGALVRRLENYPEVIAAYLFGSAAQGQLGPLSDLDLALLIESSTPRSKKLSLICNVGSDIQELHHREGDVKILNSIENLPFLYEILSTGTLIFERSPDLHRAFVAQSILRYLDFKSFHDRMLAGYQRFLRHGKAKVHHK